MKKLYVVEEYLMRKMEIEIPEIKNFCGTIDLMDQNRYEEFLSKADVAKALGVEVFDTALPQEWVNDVYERTGQSIAPHCVWSYDQDSSWGHPVAVTREGEVILKIYTHILEATGMK